MTAKTDEKRNTNNPDSWDVVQAADMIGILRDRISDLEYQLYIKDFQIKNLLKIIDSKDVGEQCR